MSLTDGKQQRLEAGMQVQASIDLDRRHLYEWIFEPFISGPAKRPHNNRGKRAMSALNFSWSRRLPVVLQTEVAECGIACLAMILSFSWPPGGSRHAPAPLCRVSKGRYAQRPHPHCWSGGSCHPRLAARV